MVTNKFNVINYDFNKKEFYAYDVIPYLLERYDKEDDDKKPKTFDEFKKFIDSWAMYQWWSRCQYEIVLQNWPNGDVDKKVDVYWQVKNNIDLITEMVMGERVTLNGGKTNG